MIILTNHQPLELSTDYLKNINIQFRYINSNVFSLTNYNPDIILSNDKEEVELASKKFPTIKFIGENLDFPNFDMKLPDYLLDELSLKIKTDIHFHPSDITYFNSGGKENYKFICQLKNLGNLRICGNGFCCDEASKSLPQRLTCELYKTSDVCAADNYQEILKILYMGKKCITNLSFDFCEHVDNRSLNLEIDPAQIEFAKKYRHTVFWANVFEVLGMNEELTKIKELESKIET